MSKILKISFSKFCNGCELCVFEVQRQFGKVGLDGALIRVLQDEKDDNRVVYRVDIDPNIKNLDLEKISQLCPLGNLVVEDVLEEEHGLTN